MALDTPWPTKIEMFRAAIKCSETLDTMEPCVLFPLKQNSISRSPLFSFIQGIGKK